MSLMEEEYRAYLASRKVPPDQLNLSVGAVKDLEAYLERNGSELKGADLGLLKGYISVLISEGRNSEDRLVAIARYCHLVRKNDYFIHIAGLVNAVEVLPGIGKRLGELAGEEVRGRVFEGIEMPPLGAPQEAYPHLTGSIVRRMEEELPLDRCIEVLTWNYHGIPAEAFQGHRERFEKAGDIDEYLRDEHRRFVEEISRFMKEGKVWYEQEITPEVVEFVEANQEISIGRKVGDRIYVTKIPFSPKQYLEEQDPKLKRYHACHCPLARASILDDESDVPSTFCYCSAGFTKLQYDVIFGEPVEIEMLESALKGDMRCRFALRIPAGKVKPKRNGG
jgi:hypothetical protein